MSSNSNLIQRFVAALVRCIYNSFKLNLCQKFMGTSLSVVVRYFCHGQFLIEVKTSVAQLILVLGHSLSTCFSFNDILVVHLIWIFNGFALLAHEKCIKIGILIGKGQALSFSLVLKVLFNLLNWINSISIVINLRYLIKVCTFIINSTM